MTSSFNVENLLSHLFVQVEANGDEIPSVGQLFLAGRPFALNADWLALHQVGAGNGLTGQDMDEVGAQIFAYASLFDYNVFPLFLLFPLFPFPFLYLYLYFSLSLSLSLLSLILYFAFIAMFCSFFLFPFFS